MNDKIDGQTLTGQSATIVLGNALAALRQLPSGSAACCITSPPYWGVRDYKLAGQIGVEPSLQLYLRKLLAVFREVRRVVSPSGIFWINIGDTYTSGNRGWRAPDKRNQARAMKNRPDNPPGLKDKELVGVPWRLALRLQNQGWYLRSDVIWHKPNGQPESVKDRPSRAHEYLFLFSKSKNYYYNQEGIMEPTADGNGAKNRRSVWSINTDNSNGPHSETFPQELVRPCILAGTQPHDLVIDPFFGYGTVGLVCQEEQRRFLGIELNRNFVDAARERLVLDGESLFRTIRGGFRIL